jgi:hypothetical protein
LAKGFEPEHVRLSPFVIAVISFVAFAAITYVALWYLVKADTHPRDVDARTSAIPTVPPATDFPRLQPTPDHDQVPKQDLESLRQNEDRLFASLGWQVDPVTHGATIPPDLVRRVGTRAHPTTQGGAR